MTPSTPSGRLVYPCDTPNGWHKWVGPRCRICGGTRGRQERALADNRAGREAVEAYRLSIAEKVRAMTGLGITGHLVPRADLLRLIEGEKPHG